MRKGSAPGGRDAIPSRRWLPAGLIVVALSSTTGGAQSLETRSAGLQSGRLNFFPSLTVDYTYTDNIFYANTNVPGGLVPSGVFTIRPQFLFSLPFSSNEIRFSYAPLLRHYGSNQYAELVTDASSRQLRSSHYFDFSGSFRLGSAISIQAAEHLLRGTQELRGVDPGGEAVFGTVPFLLNNASVEFRVDLGARSGFSVIPTYSNVTFDQSVNAVFYNYTTHGLEGRYNHLMTSATTLYASYGVETTDQTRDSSLFGDVTVDTRRAGIGVTRTLNRAIQANAFVGYSTMTFTGGADSDYSGLIFNAGTHWLISEVTRLDLTIQQQPYQSFYVNNNYYLYRAVSARLQRQVGQSILLFGGASYEDNIYSDKLDPTGFESSFCEPATITGDCPSAGERRRDHALHFEAGVGFQVRPTLRWLVGYNRDVRQSNSQQTLLDDQGAFIEFYDPFDYQVNRFFVRLELGWL